MVKQRSWLKQWGQRPPDPDQDPTAGLGRTGRRALLILTSLQDRQDQGPSTDRDYSDEDEEDTGKTYTHI